MTVELKERTGKLAVCEALQVNLKHDMGKNTYSQRHQQPFNFIFHELSYTARTQSVVQACARDHEDDRHQPVRHKGDPNLCAEISSRILDMPVVCVKKAAAVENEYRQDGNHTQPIQIITALG